MKKKLEIVLSVILVIVCITLATLFIKNDVKVKYTFFYRKDNKITMLDSFGKKVLKESLNYAGNNNGGYILIVNEDKRPAIIDELGNFIINYDEYDNIEEYGNLYIAYKGESIYVITRNNKLVREIENTKELVSRIVNGYAVLLFDKKYHIYDSEGNIIKELAYKKKSKISLKETTNYGQVFYENKEYVFSNKTFEIIEIDTSVVSDMFEVDGVLLLRDEKNRIIQNGKIINDNVECVLPTIEESGNINCGENTIFELKKEGFYTVCDKKCDLYNDSKVLLKDYDEVSINKTNLNYYFVVKKGKVTSIYNNELKRIFVTKKSVNIYTDYIEIDKKIYTFEGFEINL